VSVGDDQTLDGFLDALLDDDPVQLYDRAPCGYLSSTPDGTIVKVNETFLTLTGFDRSELVGRRRFAELLSRGGQIYHETHYAPMLRMQGAAREIALEIVRPDGVRLPVLVNSVLELDAAGNPQVIRTAVFDATQRRRYERELLRAKEQAQAAEAHATALARTLQQTLIPPATPTVPHLDVAAVYRPAGDGTEVGGDFYDIFQVADGDWVVSMGDVSGKGVAAAVVTALVRWTVRAGVVQHESPLAALRMVNDVLRQHDTERFATVALVRLTRIDGTWIALLGSGGHDLPILRKADATLSAVGAPGSLLGVMAEPDLRDYPLVLERGDTLVLFTDGLPEGRRGKEFYGEERIAAIVGADHPSAGDLAGALLADVLEFQQGNSRDDIAIVAIRVPPDTSG
jgi:sigma-B regulation protein RsbU (phosphoserine phosphatase)